MSPSQASERHIFVALHSKTTKLWILKIFLQEWDEDDLAEILEDDNSSLVKPAWPLIRRKQLSLRKLAAILLGEEVIVPKRLPGGKKIGS